jgi:starch synthase (maltosyl-transferring)
MDDQTILTSTTMTSTAAPGDARYSAVPVTPSRPVGSSFLRFDYEMNGMAGFDAALETAARLGFEGVLLASPFMAQGAADGFLIEDFERLRDGDAAEFGLRRMADAAHAVDLSVVMEVCLDRVALAAGITAAHPDWFAHGAAGASFCYLSDADAVVDWWDARLAAWQDCGIDGFRCEAAQTVPHGVWARLIGAAKRRNPHGVFIATCFGARPDEMTGLSGCGFDYAVSSSCWWDRRGAWLWDDLERVGAVGRVATLAAPPGGVADEGAVALAAFIGALWVMNAPVGTVEVAVAAMNALRRQHSGMFARPVLIGSAPGADVVVLARLPDSDDGMILALGAAGAVIDRARLLAGLGSACGEMIEADAGDFVIGAEGRLVLHTRAPKPVVRAASKAVPAKTAVKWPRIAIEAVSPTVEGGRFAVKRIVGDVVRIEADLITDGHGRLAADVVWRAADEADWQRAPMALVTNDRWAAALQVKRLGRYHVAIEAWIDRYGAFVDEVTKKAAASVDTTLEVIEGTNLLEAAVMVAEAPGHAALADVLAAVRAAPAGERLALLIAPSTVGLMRATEVRHGLLRLDPPLAIDAERTRAGFASWYEIFPRSQGKSEAEHGNFDDVIAQLPRVRAMGFDVLYFPPIHPIGVKNRKGRNNSLTPSESDPGSPYAIGSAEGGHTAIHPQLGSFEDFRRLLAAAAAQGIEIALDFAIQCAPDHPWLREHPEWFDWRPDGTIRYAENPPKKYEDIVNVDFYAEGAMPSLWVALRDVVAFWVKQGVRIFRVDNPHTKPLPFWEWMIGDIRGRWPDVMFLAEAFTKPKLMYRLAKLGFSQSYTYFTWRNTAAELREYVTELTTTAPREFFRPHFFVNTPDINPVFLQSAGRPGFLLRAALAATLSGLWGVYNGFELCEAAALPGREEYLDSEKYQMRAWDHDRPGNIVAEIAALNRMRRQNPALQSHLGVTFLNCSNERVLYFEKANADRSNVVLVAISLDPFATQTAEIELPLWRFGLGDDADLQAEDLARGVAFVWHGKRQIVGFDPQELPYCIWRVRS